MSLCRTVKCTDVVVQQLSWTRDTDIYSGLHFTIERSVYFSIDAAVTPGYTQSRVGDGKFRRSLDDLSLFHSIRYLLLDTFLFLV